jgi:PAS domain S-box-containing protein
MPKNSPDLPTAQGLSETDYALATLRKITLLVTGLATLMTPLVAMTTTNTAEIWTVSTVAVIGWFFLFLIQAKYTRYIAHAIIFSVLFIGSLGVIASGSVRSSVVFLFIGGIAAAGSFLGRRALLIATGYSVIALAALNWAEVQGYIHKANPEVGVKVWATQSICIVVVGIMVFCTRTRAEQAHRIQLDEVLRRKETEQERDQAQARFARIFRSSPSPMLAQSADSSSILDVNPAFERCFGYTKAQLVGQSDRLLWVDDANRQSYTQRLLKEHHQHQQPARGVRADGTQFEALLSSELSEEPNDRIIITIVMDVSIEHAALEQLRRSEDRFSKAFNFSPLNLTITRLSDGAIVEASQSKADIRGLGGQIQPEAVPLEASFWRNPGTREPFVQRLLREGSIHAHDVQIQQASGDWADCRIWAEQIEIDGEVCALSCTVNVTEEKRREAQLLDLASGMAGQTGHAFFSSLVNNMTRTMGADMLFVGELSDNKVVNTLAGTVDGAPLEAFTYELPGTPCNQATDQATLCIYPDQVDELFPEDLALKEGHFKAYVGQSLRDESGKPVGILAALWRRPISNSAEASALMAIYGGRAAAELLRLQRDREIQHLNETLEQRVQVRTAELQALNAELDSFAYSVSHDLKTPLRSIDGFTVLLGEELQGRLNPAEKQMFQRILNATSRMGVLIADLLALARISQSELRWQWVDLSALARDVFSNLSSTKFSGRSFDLRVEPAMQARCDPQLMRIALENLLDNAAKYTRDQPTATIEIGSVVPAPGWAAAFCVKDNGAGFNMDNAALLFKPFQRLHAPDSGFEGTGIGLATVRRIVERHGGTIGAQARTDQGAMFTLTLGFPPAPKPASQQATADAEHESA